MTRLEHRSRRANAVARESCTWATAAQRTWAQSSAQQPASHLSCFRKDWVACWKKGDAALFSESDALQIQAKDEVAVTGQCAADPLYTFADCGGALSYSFSMHIGARVECPYRWLTSQPSAM